MGHSFLGEPGNLVEMPPNIALGMPAKCGESFTRNGIMQYALYLKNDREQLAKVKPFSSIFENNLENSLAVYKNKVNFKKMEIEWFSRKHGHNSFPSQIINLSKNERGLTQGVFRLPNTNFNIGNLKNENSIIKGNPRIKLENIFKEIQRNSPGEPKIVYGLFCRTLKNLNLPNQKVTPSSRRTKFGYGEVKTPYGNRYLTKRGMKMVSALRKTKNARRSAAQNTISRGLNKLKEYKRGLVHGKGVTKPPKRITKPRILASLK